MAIREEHDFLSENERKFLFDAIHDVPHVRADGRDLMQQRKIRVQFRRTEEQSQAEVQLGRTRVIANVHGEIVAPFPDRPTEGFLHFNVELSPMASQNFEVGRPSPMAVELARIVDRGIRECRALDTEALAIVAGEKVWAITCNIHVVDHGGNLIDCVSLATIAAMMHYRRPEVLVQNNSTVVYNIDEHAAVPLSLHHIPISISFCFVESRERGEPIVFMDPTDREERVTDGSMTFTFNSFRELCAVHKIGGAAISTAEVLRCANAAAARVSELTEILKEEAEKADKLAVDQRRAFLRGRDFADVSLLSGATQHRTEVDLGEMTDFKTLHAPIALRDDPTQEESNAKVTSMAQLLESLEVAAGITENEAAPSAASGFEMSAEARDEFKKLTESRSVRDLVAGAKSSPAPSKPAPSAATTAPKQQQKKKKVEDSDSEEESVVVQSEFGGSAPAAKPVEAKKKPAKKTKKKAVSSDNDSEEEQDLSAAIKRKPHKCVKVCIRVRLDTEATSGSVQVNQQEQTISAVTNAANGNGNGTCFHFDQVLDARADQAGVFQAAADIVESVLSGYNGTIMAYGQTGAGKTFPISGGRHKFEDRGVCARSISAIFQHIERDAEHSYVVRVSYVEVYNESLYDLLEFNEPTAAGSGHHSNNNHAREELVIQENDKGQTFIKGLARPLVKSEEAAFDLLFQGETNRTIAEHCLNASSTRSHCIFTVYLEKTKSSLAGDGAPELQHMDVVVSSKLNLVDLAGSERMKKTGVSGTMLREASHINKSLTFLEQVVVALGDKKRQHIPYRQTTLTNLLKDSLGGNCRTLLMACMWPNAAHSDQSLAMLKFATRMMRVKTSAIVNMSQNGAAQLVEQYVHEIKRLKEELAMHDTLHGNSHVEYDARAITLPVRQAVYREQVRGFLRDPTAHPLPILNLLQIQQLFAGFRDIYLETQQQQLAINEPMATMSTKAGVRESKMASQLRSLRGASPPDSASSTRSSHNSAKLPLVTPFNISPETHEREQLQTYTESRDEAIHLPPIVQPRDSNNSVEHSPPSLSDKALFEMFKSLENPKPESLLDLDVAKANLRLAKAAFAQRGLEVNKLKLDIDALSLKLQALRSAESDGDDAQAAPSAQSFLMMQLRDAKKRYRNAFDSFQEKKAEVAYLSKIKDQMLQRLTREFEAWKQGGGGARQ